MDTVRSHRSFTLCLRANFTSFSVSHTSFMDSLKVFSRQV